MHHQAQGLENKRIHQLGEKDFMYMHNKKNIIIGQSLLALLDMLQYFRNLPNRN